MYLKANSFSGSVDLLSADRASTVQCAVRQAPRDCSVSSSGDGRRRVDIDYRYRVADGGQTAQAKQCFEVPTSSLISKLVQILRYVAKLLQDGGVRKTPQAWISRAHER